MLRFASLGLTAVLSFILSLSAAHADSSSGFMDVSFNEPAMGLIALIVFLLSLSVMALVLAAFRNQD